MYPVVLLCFLAQIQGFSLYHNPYWPPGTDIILDQMAKEMFGYNVEELQRINPDYTWDRHITKEVEALWKIVDKLRSHELFLNASRGVIGTFSALKEKGITKAFAKTRLADRWDELTHQEQARWKKDFPYAAYAEKLSNIRRRGSKFCFGLCSELRESSFCWYQLIQDHICNQHL